MVRRIVIGLALIVAVGLFYAAGRNGNADPEPPITETAVEALIPADGSPSVVRQAEIGIDLKDGWTGELSINGRLIPDDQIRRNDALNQIFFTPGPGKEIERLPAGIVIVSANVWRPIDGETREDGRQVVWRFSVV